MSENSDVFEFSIDTEINDGDNTATEPVEETELTADVISELPAAAAPIPEPVIEASASITQESQQALINEIFAESGIKVAQDDPILQIVIASSKIMEKNAELVSNNLDGQAGRILDNLIANQAKVDDAFDDKLTELKTLLTKLEEQKEVIVIDVWRKLEQRVMDKIQNELTGSIKKIAENSNNDVNNERLLIKGGAIGLIVGILICAIILFIFK